MTCRWLRDDSGETLVELLMTMVVVGLAAVGIMGAILTSTTASAVHRNSANDETIAKSALEQLKYQLEAAPSPLFRDCGAAGTTAATLISVWNTEMTTNGYWPTIPSGNGIYSTWISGVECFTESSSASALDDSCTAAMSGPSSSVSSTISGCSNDDSGIVEVTVGVLDASNLTTTMSTLVRNPAHSTYTTGNF